MGKRAREKKELKLASAAAEKTHIESRKQARVQPQLRYVKKVSVALAVTVFLLWLGLVVVDKINLLVQKG